MDRCQYGQVRHRTIDASQGDGYSVRYGRDGNRRDTHWDDRGRRHYAASEWGGTDARWIHRAYGRAALSGQYTDRDSVGWGACLVHRGPGENIRGRGGRRRHGWVSWCADFDVAGYARG